MPINHKSVYVKVTINWSWILMVFYSKKTPEYIYCVSRCFQGVPFGASLKPPLIKQWHSVCIYSVPGNRSLSPATRHRATKSAFFSFAQNCQLTNELEARYKSKQLKNDCDAYLHKLFLSVIETSLIHCIDEQPTKYVIKC